MQFDGKRIVPMQEARCALGGIGRTTLYELVKQGEIVKVNIGSRGFITAESLGAYLDRLRASATGLGIEVHDQAAPVGDGGVL